NKEYTGCRDKNLPEKESILISDYKLYFCKQSKIWGNSGVAFISETPVKTTTTFMKLYLITVSQFRDIFLQENGVNPNDSNLKLDLSHFSENTWCWGNDKEHTWYGRILRIGIVSGFPVFTFTAKWNYIDIQGTPPHRAYLSVIIKGLAEGFNLTAEDIAQYLSEKKGIQEYYTLVSIRQIIKEVIVV
ncbi:MAG: hypothetical protein JXJ04_10830, partial [Spirochaetales bacterium]|nr:hypothetical protein [Spirochaetales bacterium]